MSFNDDWGMGVKKTSIQEKIDEEIEDMRREKKESEHNVFHIIGSAVDRKFIPTAEEYDKISPYLFLRYFSNDPVGLMIVNELNVRNNIPRKWEYWFMRDMMPKSTRFIRYSKKDKFDDEHFLEHLTHYFKCNDRQALEYLDILPDEEIDKIKDLYRGGVMAKSGKNK